MKPHLMFFVVVGFFSNKLTSIINPDDNKLRKYQTFIYYTFSNRNTARMMKIVKESMTITYS